MSIRLHADWRQAWRWFSMQAMAIDAAFLMTWATLPDDLKTLLPGWLTPAVAIFVLVVGMAGRLVKQAPPPEEPRPKTELGK